MEDTITKLVELGHIQSLQLQKQEADKQAQQLKEVEESWIEFSVKLQRRLPEVLQGYVLTRKYNDLAPSLPIVAPENIFEQAPHWEWVSIVIPGLSPIEARIYKSSILYVLPALINHLNEPPELTLSHSYIDKYYQESELPLLLYDACQVQKNFEQLTKDFEKRQAEKERKAQVKTPEYIPVENDLADPLAGEYVCKFRQFVRQIVTEVQLA